MYGGGNKEKDVNEYLLRYPKDKRKQDAYENACDCIKWGIGSEEWHYCGLLKYDKIHVWNMAIRDMGMI